MPGTTWTAQIGAGSATAFSSLKITSCVVNLQAGGEDSAELAFALAASAAAPMPPPEAVASSYVRKTAASAFDPRNASTAASPAWLATTKKSST